VAREIIFRDLKSSILLMAQRLGYGLDDRGRRSVPGCGMMLTCPVHLTSRLSVRLVIPDLPIKFSWCGT
jgi:hypothetical protein